MSDQTPTRKLIEQLRILADWFAPVEYSVEPEYSYGVLLREAAQRLEDYETGTKILRERLARYVTAADPTVRLPFSEPA